MTDPSAFDIDEASQRRKCKMCDKKNVFLMCKTSLFILCFFMFMYQATSVLITYWSYPTIMHTEAEAGRTIMVPAFTFCESSSVFRRTFCAEHEDDCKYLTEGHKICTKYPMLCEGEKQIFSISQLTLDEEDLKSLGRNLADFLVSHYLETDEEDDDDEENNDDEENKSQEDDEEEETESGVVEKTEETVYEGSDEEEVSEDNDEETVSENNDEEIEQFLVSNNISREIFKCYVINSRVDSYEFPSQIKLDTANFLKNGKLEILKLKLRINLDDEILPWIKHGAYFQMHSPFVSVNPTDEGILLKPGTSNEFHLHLEEEHLLPFPYGTDCINYTSLWERNNRTGFRSQEMCISECQIDYIPGFEECVPLWVQNPHAQTYCIESWENDFKEDNDENTTEEDSSEDDDESTTEAATANNHDADNHDTGTDEYDDDDSELNECVSMCKPDCVKHKYKYTLHEEPYYNAEEEEGQDIQFIEVTVSLHNSEVLTTKHQPQYEVLDLFTYIGGLSACWIGLSLYAMPDVIQTIYFFIKKPFIWCTRRGKYHVNNT